jgi:ParB family chromosome partitioning protein
MKQRRFTPGVPMPDYSNSRATHNVQQEQAAAVAPADGELIDLSIDLIDPNPLAPREIYTQQMILERADNLRSQGQHDAIHVTPNPNASGRYIICDGWTRVLACREHKALPSLLARVHHDLTPEQSAWFGYEQNEGRQQQCDFDRAMFFEKIIAAGESAAEVSRRAKLSKTLMSFYRAYGKLPDEVLDYVRQDPAKFSANAAYQLAKLHDQCGTRKTVALAAKYAAEDQPVRWLVNQVQAYLSPSVHTATSASKQVRYSNGYYKQKDDKFEVAITVQPERRAEFAAALESLLNTVAEQLPSKTKIVVGE